MRTSGGARRLAAVVVTLGAVLATGPSPAAASEAPSDALSATVGFGGHTVAGAWAPVEVELQPDRPLTGRLAVTVTSSGTSLRFERPVDVAGASRERYRFVVPAPDQVHVGLDAGGQLATLRPPTRQLPTSAFLVGVLGGVPDEVPDVESYASERRATYVAIDPAWLSETPRALESLGTLVAPAAQLAELPDRARQAVVAAVAGGMNLTVIGDAPLPAPLPAPSPEAWTLQAADVGADGDAVLARAEPVGRGRVAVTPVSFGAPDLGRSPALWAHLLQPGGRLALRAPHQEGAAVEVLGRGGLAVPTVPWLALFLLGYVAAVGPVNGLVLSRLRRRDLAWVTVPAITGLFAAVAFGASSASQPPVGISAGATTWVGPVGTELALVAVRAPTRGEHEVTLPGEGWAVAVSRTRAPATVRGAADGTAVTLDLEALEVGTVVANRRATGTPPLTVTAAATSGDEVTVTVRNSSSEPVRDVVVMAGVRTVPAVDLLAPGAETTVAVPGSLLVADPSWAHEIGARQEPDGRAATSQAMRSLLHVDLLDGNPGTVWAVAETDRDGAPVTADGRSTDSRGALVAVGAPVTVGRAGVPALAVQRTVAAHGSGDGWWGSQTAIESADASVLRFRLPPGTVLGELAHTLDRTSVHPEHGFRREPPPPCPPGAACPVPAIPVPAVDPEAPEKLQVELQVWNVHERTWMALDRAFTAAADDPTVVVSPLGELYVRHTAPGLFEFSGRGIAVTADGR